MVDKDYSLREICSSVKFLMSPVGQSLRRVTHYEGVEMGRVMECAKTIVQARTVSCQSENLLFKKYKQVRYLQVSERPFLLEEA